MTAARIARIAALIVLAGTATGALVGLLREYRIAHALDWSVG